MAQSVFYSFHYDRDVHRVQLIRNMGALESQPILNPQDWEKVEEGGSDAIEAWIHKQMVYTKAVIVLIGRETSKRPWVKYEIEKAWSEKRPLLGIRIHGISSMGTVDSAGPNPFDSADVGTVPIYDPTVTDWSGKIDSQKTYDRLKNSLASWSGLGAVKSSW